MIDPIRYDPGELDQKLQVLRLVKVEDEGGGFETEETVFIPSLWAKIKPNSGGENYEYDRVNDVETVTFVIRYREDILSTDVIVWRGTKFNIRLIPSVNFRSTWLEITAEKGKGF